MSQTLNLMRCSQKWRVAGVFELSCLGCGASDERDSAFPVWGPSVFSVVPFLFRCPDNRLPLSCKLYRHVLSALLLFNTIYSHSSPSGSEEDDRSPLRRHPATLGEAGEQGRLYCCEWFGSQHYQRHQWELRAGDHPQKDERAGQCQIAVRASCRAAPLWSTSVAGHL